MRRHILLVAAVLSGLSCADATEPAAPPPPPAVSVTPAADTLAIGHTLRLRATVTGAGGRVIWTSSDDSVAAVDASGLVTGVTAGTATITASSGTAQGRAEIRVATDEWMALAAFYHATDGRTGGFAISG
ncbi:Ig-like domain-containing protein [Candidatus Palauibacter sp.]|uniref:Ig-like domain-containing protein n=1 Tax=Candidatus Palauibacter sp. TaxID=3101350 RepID=UPI003B017760